MPMPDPTMNVAGSPTRVNNPAEFAIATRKTSGGTGSRPMRSHARSRIGAKSRITVAFGRKAQVGMAASAKAISRRAPPPLAKRTSR